MNEHMHSPDDNEATDARLEIQYDEILELLCERLGVTESEEMQHTGEAYIAAQIGLTIWLALLRRDASAIDEFVYHMDEAIDFAYNYGYEAIVAVLESQRVAVKCYDRGELS